MSIEHKIGDLVMGININRQRVLGVIKAKKLSVNNELKYQVEWANNLYCDLWYGENYINCYKETYDEYTRGSV